MAGDWIKVQKETPDKPEIAILANILEITYAEAFLSWFRVYTWADGITVDGNVPFLSRSDGDRLSRCCPGTCETMSLSEIDWIGPIKGDWSNGFYFKKWDRHNGKSSKTRASEAEKKRRQRQNVPILSRKCPDDNGTKTGPEKRREEKSINTPIVPLPDALNTPDFASAWQDWIKHRSEIGKKLRSTGAKGSLEMLEKLGAVRAASAIRYSIAQGWQGIYEEKESQNGKAKTEGSSRVHTRGADYYAACAKKSQDSITNAIGRQAAAENDRQGSGQG